MKEIERWEVIPQVVVINQFFDHPLFIKAFAAIGSKIYGPRSLTTIICLVIMAYLSIRSTMVIRSSVLRLRVC